MCRLMKFKFTALKTGYLDLIPLDVFASPDVLHREIVESNSEATKQSPPRYDLDSNPKPHEPVDVEPQVRMS
jgi:hypothetical protein